MPTELITTIVQLAVTALIGLAVWEAKRVFAGLPADKRAALQGMAGTAVKAVEQQSADMGNPAKKVLAMNLVRDGLAAIGIKGIPDTIISAAIEAEVYATKSLTGDLLTAPATSVASPPTVANTAPTK